MYLIGQQSVKYQKFGCALYVSTSSASDKKNNAIAADMSIIILGIKLMPNLHCISILTTLALVLLSS